MNNNLTFLQELTEEELCELILLPLLEHLGFEDIRYIHGNLEFGKDIICKKHDKLEGIQYVGFVVKSKKVTGTVSSSSALREIYFQIDQSLTSPFIDPSNGNSIHLTRVYFVTPYQISQNSIYSLKDSLERRESKISFIDGVGLLDLIKQYDPGLIDSVPVPEQRYLRVLLTRFSKNLVVNKIGFSKDTSLEDVYISPNLTSTTPEKARYINLGEPIVENGNDFFEIFELNNKLVILADAGAGKSTLLYNLIVKLSSEFKSTNNEAVIPLIIELSMIPMGRISDFNDFKKWIRNYVSEVFGYIDFEVKENCRYLLLLDGYDELKSHHDRMLDFITKLSHVFLNGIIVTSRPSRIPNLNSDFHFYKLNPFSNDEIKKFLSNWYGENDKKADDVYNYIVGDRILLNFCRTPLILSLFAILSFREDIHNLPKRRTEIYQQIIELLVDKWDAMREIKSEYLPMIKHFVLEKIAYLTHCKGSKFFYFEDVLKISNTYTDLSEHDTFLLLDELVFRSSIIMRVDVNTYSFVHLSFQEFFCAKYLFRFYDAHKIQSVLFNQWWINTMKFYFGLQQSLDDLRIFDRKIEGVGHILFQYLNETTFTSVHKKEQIYEAFCRQILGYGDLDEELVKIFVENYELLIPVIDRESIKGSFRFLQNNKYLKILTYLGSKGIKYIDLEKYPVPLHSIPEIQMFLLKHLDDEHAYKSFKVSLKLFETEVKRSTEFKTLKKLVDELDNQRKIVSINSALDRKEKVEIVQIINNNIKLLEDKMCGKI